MTVQLRLEKSQAVEQWSMHQANGFLWTLLYVNPRVSMTNGFGYSKGKIQTHLEQARDQIRLQLLSTLWFEQGL